MKGVQQQNNGVWAASYFTSSRVTSHIPSAAIKYSPVASLQELANAALLTSVPLLQLPLEMLSYLRHFLDPHSAGMFAQTCQMISSAHSSEEKEMLLLERKYAMLMEHIAHKPEDKAPLKRYYQFILSKIVDNTISDKLCYSLTHLAERFFQHFSHNELKSQINQLCAAQPASYDWQALFKRLLRINLHLCVTFLTMASPGFDAKNEGLKSVLLRIKRKAHYPFTEYYSLVADKLSFNTGQINFPNFRGLNGHGVVQDNIVLSNARAQQFFRHIRYMDHSHNTVLHFAVLYGYLDIVPSLLQAPHCIDLMDDAGKTVLIAACMQIYRHGVPPIDYPRLIQTLLALNANPNLQDKHGNTALMYIARKNDFIILQDLLDHGADVNLVDTRGNTALFNTMTVQAAALLLERGANINHQDIIGNTVLIQASSMCTASEAQQRELDFIHFLLKRGAQVNVQNKDGSTALMYASRKGNLGIIQLLLGYGAELEMKDKRGNTALDYASRAGKHEAEQLLLTYGQAKALSPQLVANAIYEMLPALVK
jgi:ankyrin repeat protein